MRNQNPGYSIMLIVSSIFLAMVPQLAAAATETIKNVPPTEHFAPAGTPLGDIATAVKLGANDEGWRIIEEHPGLVQASLRIRTHKAVVIIGFDESRYWIEYQDSSNLDYKASSRKKTKTRKEVKGPRIHSNYNIWVGELSKRIAIRTRIPRRRRGSDAPARDPILIADELEKLDALRVRGVLTQDEFDQQKAKLLRR